MYDFVKHRYVMHLQYQQVKGWLKERPYHQQRFYAFGKEKPIYLVLPSYLSHETNSEIRTKKIISQIIISCQKCIGTFHKQMFYSFRNRALQSIMYHSIIIPPSPFFAGLGHDQELPPDPSDKTGLPVSS